MDKAMQHPMTARTDDSQVSQLRLALTLREQIEVMNFRIATADRSINALSIPIATLAFKFSCPIEDVLDFLASEGLTALTMLVSPKNLAALGRRNRPFDVGCHRGKRPSSRIGPM